MTAANTASTVMTLNSDGQEPHLEDVASSNDATTAAAAAAATTAAAPCLDPHVPNDYISRRKRAYEGTGWDTDRQVPASSSQLRQDAWDGVSQIERDLVDCCEPLEKDSHNDDIKENTKNPKNEYGEIDQYSTADTDDYIRQWVAIKASSTSRHMGGVLAVEHEVRFASLLANDCSTTASKSLALAILERTLEVYLREEQDALKDTPTQKQEANVTSYDDAIQQEAMVTRSSRFTRIQNQRKRMQPNNSSDNEGEPASQSNHRQGDSSSVETPRRFERFFAAGGLKVLSQWLEDAAGYDIVIVKQQKVIGKNRNSPATEQTAITQRKAPSARPIVHTILRFLEHIPFDKQIVLQSKINKQIQNLGKRVAAILEAKEAGRARREDLENWTADENASAANALADVSHAVKALKTAWREKTAMAPKTVESLVADPFEKVKEQMKSRLQEIIQFEAGAAPAPAWYEPLDETPVACRAVPRPVSKGKNSIAAPMPAQKSSIAHAAKVSSSKVQELAAKERRAERMENQQKFQQLMKSNKQQSLESLREKLRQQREEYSKRMLTPSLRKGASNGKGVRWKDGLRAQQMRNRKKLEEVFVFVKGTCAARSGGKDSFDSLADAR
jgi:hypothetical protein